MNEEECGGLWGTGEFRSGHQRWDHAYTDDQVWARDIHPPPVHERDLWLFHCYVQGLTCRDRARVHNPRCSDDKSGHFALARQAVEAGFPAGGAWGAATYYRWLYLTLHQVAEENARRLWMSWWEDFFIYRIEDQALKRFPDRPVPEPAFRSPIEKAFWAAWQVMGLQEQFPLVPQHPVILDSHRYRLDFALPDFKFGIELDGLAGHSSTTALAADHKRQRALELTGWKIARFGGQEVHRDANWCVRETLKLLRQWRS